MTSSSVTSEQDTIKVLSDRFWDAYKAMRQEWLKTGGGMDIELSIRDASAEANYQRRRIAAKKGAAKRRQRRMP